MTVKGLRFQNVFRNKLYVIHIPRSTILTIIKTAAAFGQGRKYQFKIRISFGRRVYLYTNRNTLGSSQKQLFPTFPDRKSTRLNSSHVRISYAVFCLKKKKKYKLHYKLSLTTTAHHLSCR